ncbi:vacuolar sorting-associated-like protein [Medicago truncatula]|nr:vacuolar sorting-associated-like protein [Medicago truncatula]
MPGPASNGDAAVTLRPETKPKNDGERDGEGDGEDPEKSKVRAGFNSAFFKEQAIEYVKQAVQEDNAGNYAKAFPLYMNTLEYFKTHLKYEKNPKIREAITQKCTGYLRRAEEIRFVLGDGLPRPASDGDVAVALRQEMKQENGGERSGEDPEQDKLRAGLNSTIVMEKPNNVAEKPRTAMGRCWPCKFKQRTRSRS